MDDYRLEYEERKSKLLFFIDYILPWLILLGICVGIYLAANYFLQALFLLSEPLSKVL